MRIQHNIAAMNSYRNLGVNNTALGKNLEKLSSGYKINRAGDDAAGLAISEKMRAQITGLQKAQDNANDGIALVQTAEGALTEVHSMLNRMTELANQSANGTYQNEIDRENLQKEITSLKSEIDRIAESTNFNGINLLDGSLEAGKAQGGGSVTVDLSALSGTMMGGVTTIDATKGKFSTGDGVALGSVAGLGATNVGDKIEYSFEYIDNDGNHQQSTISFEVALAEGKKLSDVDGTNTNVFVLKAEDGTTYGVAAADEIAGDELADALVAEFAKNSDLAANFKASEQDTDGALNFTAVKAGADGATLQSMTQTLTVKGTGSTTNTSVTIEVGTNYAAAGDSGTAGQSSAVDSFKALDLSKAKAWEGDASKLAESIFEINGEKFVFVSQDVTITDEHKNLLAEAGVGNNYVQLQAGTTVDNQATLDMAEKIGAATGLLVEAGKATIADTNTWADAVSTTNTDTDETYISLRDAVAQGGKESGGLTLQIGDTAEAFNQLTVSVGDMSSKALGIDKVDISTQDGAAAAMEKIKNAINQVSSTRGDLGAIQNRLEHTINNLGVTEENMTSAESRIRDTDMAAEMMEYTKNNILIQASQAMLAQANQLPQGVLQLLG